VSASTHPDAVGRYNVGDLARVSATIVASGGVITQPSSLVMILKAPSSIASYVFGQAGASIANPAPGTFYKDVTISQVGTWAYGFQASGLVQAAEEWVMLCDTSRVFNL